MPARIASPFPTQLVFQDVDPSLLELEEARYASQGSPNSEGAWQDFLRKMLPPSPPPQPAKPN